MPRKAVAATLALDFRDVIERAANTATAAANQGEKAIPPVIQQLLSHYMVPIEEDYIKAALSEHLHVQHQASELSAYSL